MQRRSTAHDGRTNPDAHDIPLGSRLFLVVPREADQKVLQAELHRYEGCEHVKVDAVAAKGICFAKYETVEAANRAMEGIHKAECKVGPYRVKVFPAEPKGDTYRSVAHISPSPPPAQYRLPESLYEQLPFTSSTAVSPYLDAPLLNETVHPSSTGSLAAQSAANSARLAPQSGSSLRSTPHSFGVSVHPASGGSTSHVSVSRQAYDSNLSALQLSHQLLMAQQQGLPQTSPSRSGSITNSMYEKRDSAGQQLAQLFARLQTSDDRGAGPAVSSNSGTMRSSGNTGFPMGTTVDDVAALCQMWPEHSQLPLGYPHRHVGNASMPKSGRMATSVGLRDPPPPLAVYNERTGTNPSVTDSMVGFPGWHSTSSNGPANSTLPEVSLQRLFVVVSKSATEEQIAKQFKKFGGMEYCNLKRDKKTGQSKGYCFVNYSTAESAAAAMKALNGMEFPTGSGRMMKTKASPAVPK